MMPIPLGPFALHRPIRRGGMAEVWSGVHVGQSVPVAIKVMTGERARHPAYLRAFRNEVQAVAALDHPGIILIFDHGEVTAEAEEVSGRRFVAGSPYLVMELASLGSLDQVQRRLSWPELKGLLLALLDALAHAHARGVVHRDLKPGNVLLMGSGDPREGLKLTDFGLAHAVEEQSREGTRESMAGTPRYMAPEMFEGRWRTYGPWTDLYALGCMTWELIEGRPLFAGSTADALRRQHLYEPPRPLRKHARLPERLDGWLARLLCKRPSERFQSSADAAWALLSLGEPAQAEALSLQGSGSLPAAHTDILTLSGLGSPSTLLLPAVTQLTDTMLVAQEGFHELATYVLPSEGLERAPTWIMPAVRTFANAPTFLQEEGEEDPLRRAHALAQARAQATGSGSRAAVGPPPGEQGARAAPMPVALPPIPRTWHRTTTPAPAMSLVGAGLSLFGLRTVRFVGRQKERDAIWKALAEVCEEGRSRLILLRGDAGIGKTRLAHWVGERAQELGAAVTLKATHSPLPGPANGLSGMMARHLRCLGLSRADVRRLVRNHLKDYGVSDDYEWDALTQLIMAPVAQERSARAKVVRFRNPAERYVLLRRYLERQGRAAVLILDDVQWGSDALWFAQHLLRHQALHPLPVLLLMTARDEELANRTMESHILKQIMGLHEAQELRLGPLEERASARLVQGLLGLESELAARVQERAGGNPLYAIELVGSWVERGVLAVGPEGFVLKEGAEAVAPDNIEELWNTRITRLLDESLDRAQAERAMEIAAVLGQDVDANEWRLACEAAGIELTLDLFHALVLAGVVLPGQGYWSFTHGLVRDALLRSAREGGRWAAHHLASAQMLSRRYQTESGGVAERLGRHLIEAGALDEALPSLLHGAREHIDASEYRRALELLGLYQEALARQGVAEADPRHGVGWVLQIQIHRLTGLFDEAFSWAERAVSAAWAHRWDELLPQLLTELGQVAVLRGDLELADNIYAEALEEHQRRGDTVGVAQCLHGEGQVAYRRGDLPQATRLLRKSLLTYERLGDKAGIAAVLQSLWGVVRQRGDLQLADDLIQQALALHEEQGNQLGVAECLTGRGQIAVRQEQLPKAAHLFQRAMEIFEHLGAQTGVAVCLDGLAEVGQEQSDYAAAESWSRRALALQEASGAGDAIVSRVSLGLSMVGAQRTREAREHLEATREVAEAEGRRGLSAIIHAHLLLCAGQEQRWAAWDQHKLASVALLEATGLLDARLAQALERAGEAASAAGEVARAQEALSLAQRHWRALRRPEQAERVQHTIRALPPEAQTPA
jgi:serine/threonine protein kinase/tetratricopeptide (TPR) repeat protein